MSTIIILTPPPPPPPPPDDPNFAESTADVVRIGNSQIEFQGGRPTFGVLCRAVVDLFRAWRS